MNNYVGDHATSSNRGSTMDDQMPIDTTRGRRTSTRDITPPSKGKCLRMMMMVVMTVATVL